MSRLPMLITASVAAAHLTLLLLKADILSKPRNLLKRVSLLKRLLECPLCLGWWVATATYLMASLWPLPIEVLAVAGLAHMIYLYRERNLPCPDCEKKAKNGDYEIRG